MKWTHWKLGTVLLGVLIVLCLLWWPAAEAPAPIQPIAIPDEAPIAPQPVVRPRAPQRPRYRDESATRPSRLATAEELKRSKPEVQDFYSVDLDTSRCYGRLLQAARDGVPNPDTEDLRGCAGRTPLFVADTPDQVRELLAAGVDVNAQDRGGRTALHAHAVPHSATEDSLAIIDLLLDAGADPRLENEHGEAPWKVARLHSIVQSRHLWLHEKIAKETEARGLSVEAYLASRPHLQEWADGLLEGYLVEAKIQRVLLTAAVNATPTVASRYGSSPMEIP